MTTLIFQLMLVFLILLLVAETKKNLILKILSKTMASSCFVAYAYQLEISSEYDGLVFSGLVFSLIGDILLISLHKKIFLLGLVSFLVAHIFYAVAFLPLFSFTYLWLALLIIPFSLSYFFFRHIRNSLGTMFIPVILYFLVINTMLCMAFGIILQNILSQEIYFGCISIFLGALLFYLSDMAVARERFIAKSIINKIWGLPFYYFGQFLIALSIAYF